MNTIEQKEKQASGYLFKEAQVLAMEYSQRDDVDAATLALLWCAFETEAMAQGLTTWRGIQLGDV